jgi:hypothetical protein
MVVVLEVESQRSRVCLVTSGRRVEAASGEVVPVVC